MKLKKKIAASLTAFLCLGTCFVSAAASTQDDVLEAARKAGFPESLVQQGFNYINGVDYSSDEYDLMINAINEYSQKTDEEIANILESNGIEVPAEYSGAENKTSEPAAQEPAAPEQAVTDKAEENKPAVSESEKTVNYSDLSEEEKKEYIANMSQAQKNEIIKNLDTEKKVEIINKFIDASEELGMNVTVDDISKDSISYSIRDNEGGLVDISAVGSGLVDDTGIDYTLLVLGCLAVVVLSCFGFVMFMRLQNK